MKIARRLFLGVILLGLCGSVYAAEKAADKRNWPKTVDEAVQRMIDELPAEMLLEIAYTPKDHLIMYHRFLGMGIRNRYGLWRGNTSLLRSCGSADMHPDSASTVIIKATWERLREKMEPESRRRLEALQKADDEIWLKPGNYEKTKLKDLVREINEQIANSSNGIEGMKLTLVPEIAEKEIDFKSVDVGYLSTFFLIIKMRHNVQVKYNPPGIRLMPLKE